MAAQRLPNAPSFAVELKKCRRRSGRGGLALQQGTLATRASTWPDCPHQNRRDALGARCDEEDAEGALSNGEADSLPIKRLRGLVDPVEKRKRKPIRAVHDGYGSCRGLIDLLSPWTTESHSGLWVAACGRRWKGATIELSADGRDLHLKSRRIFAMIEDLVQTLISTNEMRTGHLTVGLCGPYLVNGSAGRRCRWLVGSW